MEFKKNTDVLNAEGEVIGSIDRVVIDPQTRQVTHLVAKKGVFFTREKLIPIDRIKQVNEEQVQLQDTRDPDQLIDFEESFHVPADSARGGRDRYGYAQPMVWYPRAGMLTWGEGTYPAYRTPEVFVRQRRNIPEGTVPLEEGAKVICRDGQKAGKVEQIYSEPEEHRATHIVVSSGLISKDRKLVPSVWIDRIEEDRVQLNVDCDVIDSLPSFSES